MNKTKIDENLISEILQDINENELIEIENEFSHITFELSEETENKILVSIQEQSQSSTTKIKFIDTMTKKVAILVVVLFSVVATSFVNVEGLSDKFTSFIIETYEKISVVFISENDSDEIENIEHSYSPSWLPDGFEMDFEGELSTARYISYSNNDGGSFTFVQDVRGSQSFSIDTVNSTVEKVFVGGIEAVYSHKNNADECVLVFVYGDYLFIFDAQNVGFDELILIAKSVILILI